MSTPSTLAQAIATAAGNNLAGYNPSLTALQQAIAGGNLAYAATVDGFSAVTFTEVLGGVGFQHGWGNFGGANQTASYFKDIFGFVHLRGCISGGTIGQVVFQFPAGYQPPALIAFAVNSNNAFGTIGIDASGNVTVSVGSNAFVFLDGITFYASH